MDNCIELLKTNPARLGIVSGFEDLKDIHNEWIKSFLFATNDQTLQAHRRQL